MNSKILSTGPAPTATICQQIFPVLVILSFAALTGCGGSGSGSSGSGGSGSTSNTAPTISASPVVAMATVAQAAPTSVVTAAFTDAPAGATFSTESTSSGIASISAPTNSATQGSFTITFKTPSTLKPAVYSDTVTLLLCSDPQCKVVVASKALAVTYTVSAASGSSAPTVALDAPSESYSALYIGKSPITVTLDPDAFTFTNFLSAPFVTVNAPTTGGIQLATFTMSDATHGGIVFTFAPPSSLAQNTYATTVTLQVCLDSACVNPVTSGNLTLTVNYVVTNTVIVSGDNGYTISAYPVAASLLEGNAQQNSIFAVVPSADDTTASLQAVNGTTGRASLPALSLPHDSVAAALSDDGQFLYLSQNATVLQVQTSSLLPGITIPASAGVSGNSIAVQPGQSQTIAIADSNTNTIQIFDGTTARPDAVSGEFVGSVAWTDNLAVLTAIQGLTTALSECSYSVDNSGVSGTGSNCVSAYYGGPANYNAFYTFVGGYGYGSAGAVFQESTWSYVAVLSFNGLPAEMVVPDGTTGKAFAISPNTPTPTCELVSFSLSSNAPIANLALPALGSSFDCDRYDQLVRWGSDGLALATGTDIVIISGAFVQPI